MRGRDPERRRRAPGELPEDQRIAFRIGINLGDIIIEDDDIHGDGVNVAARLEGARRTGRDLCRAQRPQPDQGKLALPFESWARTG